MYELDIAECNDIFYIYLLDIVECNNEQQHTCSEDATCANTVGGYECECNVGFELANDQRTCESKFHSSFYNQISLFFIQNPFLSGIFKRINLC